MPRVETEAGPVHYEDSGGSGPAVLFAHGFLMDRTMFAPQVEALAPDYRCLRLDERGFGETPARGPFDFWDLAGDAVRILDDAGVDRAVLCGMSQGGFLALRAALRHPERVAGLVLIDTQAGAEDDDAREAYRQMFATWREHGPLPELTGEIARLILGPDPELRREWIARWEAIDPASLEEPVRCLLEREDVTDRLPEIRAPALVVHGEEDEAIPIERAEELCEQIPDCRGLVRVPGAAHAPNLTHPEEMNPPLREFLDAIRSATAGRAGRGGG